MSCEDCIHYDICIFHIKGDENKICKHFKIEANVVEVVRCKDCKHWEHEEDVDFVCKRHYGYRTSSDYCSSGEWRELTTQKPGG